MSTCMVHPGSSKYGFVTVDAVLDEPGCTIHVDMIYRTVLATTVLLKMSPRDRNRYL